MADETRATADSMKEADSVKGEKAERIDGQINEIRETLGVLESNLPQQVDGYALSKKSKLPWKVLLYRDALIWRIVELGRSALERPRRPTGVGHCCHEGSGGDERGVVVSLC